MHYHDGDEFRGVNKFTYFFKNKNPRYGWGYPNLVKDPNGVEDPDKNGYDKKSKANLNAKKPKPKKENTEVAEDVKTESSKTSSTNTETK